MDLINATQMASGYTMGMDPDGREHLLVVVKGTFSIPVDGSEPRLLEEQVPPVEADTFTGDPGVSAPIYETDYALVKRRCDVVLNGSAYTLEGQPANNVGVGLRVGSMSKAFNVVGDRVWEASVVSTSLSKPEPFVVKPISYDKAFGGLDNYHEDEKKHSAYMLNPVGCGYHAQTGNSLVDKTPAPNTEEPGKQIQKPSGKYRPMSFGPIGRGWEPRYLSAGTYDQNWLDNVFPFLPADFQETYYQCAPQDQQIKFLRGDEIVDLINLTAQGRTSFKIPTIEVPVVFFRKKGDRDEKQAVADTLVIEPDLNRFSITWRASVPLKKNMFEIPQVLVGHKSRAWWRARDLGKTYYVSLEELRLSKLREAAEEDA